MVVGVVDNGGVGGEDVCGGDGRDGAWMLRWFSGDVDDEVMV